MKKFFFTLAVLLMAGNAMADRVVTFDMESDIANFVQFVYDGEIDGVDVNYGQFQLSKDGVTIDLFKWYDEADDMYPWEADPSFYVSPRENGPSMTVFSELYAVDEDAPSYERYYGGIREIVIETFVTGPGEAESSLAQYLHVIRPNGFDDEYTVSADGAIGTYRNVSNDGHCPQFVDFAADLHVRISKITVTLYGVEDNPGTDPSVMTAAPVFNGYTEDGIHAYFVEILETEPSTIYYRVQYPDGTWTEWAEYEEILSFTGDGKYRVEAYAIAPGKAKSFEIAYEFVVAPLSGIDEMMSGKTVAGVRYFNMAGQEMTEANGLTIMVTTYTDGTTSAVKVVK